uniref:Uncharacterized protein n=1 Tax=Oryza punctata TaxID=4537 RepID=A0A0E0M528_ORYPU
MAKGMGVVKPIRPQPLAPYLIGIVAKGMPPSLEATYFRPQPLALYLIGTVAKPIRPHPLAPYLIGTLAKSMGVAKPSPWRRTLLVVWRRAWVWQKAQEARVAS